MLARGPSSSWAARRTSRARTRPDLIRPDQREPHGVWSPGRRGPLGLHRRQRQPGRRWRRRRSRELLGGDHPPERTASAGAVVTRPEPGLPRLHRLRGRRDRGQSSTSAVSPRAGLGSLRDQVGGSATWNNNTMGDPDPMEIGSNLINGNMTCFGNSEGGTAGVQFGDGGAAPARWAGSVSDSAASTCSSRTLRQKPWPRP